MQKNIAYVSCHTQGFNLSFVLWCITRCRSVVSIQEVFPDWLNGLVIGIVWKISQNLAATELLRKDNKSTLVVQPPDTCTTLLSSCQKCSHNTMKHADTVWKPVELFKSGRKKDQTSFGWQRSALSLINYFGFLSLSASISMTLDDSKPWLTGL